MRAKNNSKDYEELFTFICSPFSFINYKLIAIVIIKKTFLLLPATLASGKYFGTNIRIIEDDDYDSSEDYDQDMSQRAPDKFIVELKEAKENQIRDATTVNITTTSIYDFQGKLSRELRLRRMYYHPSSCIRMTCRTFDRPLPPHVIANCINWLEM